MGRPNKYDWDSAKKYYLSGATRDEIVKKFKVPRNKLAEKIQLWGEVSDISKSVHEGFIEVSDKVFTLSETSPELVDATMKIAQDRNPKFRKIIEDLTELNMNNLKKHLMGNKKLEKINVGAGIQRFEEVGLGTSDFKEAQDTIDKASLTLGVNQRHAPRMDVTQMQAVQASGTTKIEIIEDRAVND